MGNIFNDDFRDFIHALNNNDVEYILVGGYSVILHGYVRTTGDMDVWVNKTAENYQKLIKAFFEFGLATFDMTEENFLHNSSKVNAETKDNVSWKDKVYKYNSQYKINDFALFVTYGRTSFPTTVIMPEDGSAPIPIAGYLEPKELEPILKYFGEGAYKTMNFPQFEKTFKSSW